MPGNMWPPLRHAGSFNGGVQKGLLTPTCLLDCRHLACGVMVRFVRFNDGVNRFQGLGMDFPGRGCCPRFACAVVFDIISFDQVHLIKRDRPHYQRWA